MSSSFFDTDRALKFISGLVISALNVRGAESEHGSFVIINVLVALIGIYMMISVVFEDWKENLAIRRELDELDRES